MIKCQNIPRELIPIKFYDSQVCLQSKKKLVVCESSSSLDVIQAKWKKINFF